MLLELESIYRRQYAGVDVMRILFRLACLAILLLGFSAPSSADDTICRLDAYGTANNGMPDCQLSLYNASDSSWGVREAVGSPYVGARINHSHTAIAPILAFNQCMFVDNVSATDDGFVPFRKQEEWTAFLSNAPGTQFSLTPCAYPYNGTDTSRSLAFGPTTYNESMGDVKDSAGEGNYAPVDLPYWRTSVNFPSNGQTYTHSFSNYQCYREYSQYKCWNMVHQTCTVCDTSDIFGNCTSSHQTDCSYCSDSGSTCEKDWDHHWSETFAFSGTPGNGDGGATDGGWITGRSWRVSSDTRPDACNVRCTDTGHDCLNCGEVQGTAASTCSVPDQHTFDSYAMFYCTVNSGTTTTCEIWVIQVLQYESQVSSALASGDTCTAKSLRDSENDMIDQINTFSQQFYWQYVSQHG